MGLQTEQQTQNNASKADALVPKQVYIYQIILPVVFQDGRSLYSRCHTCMERPPVVAHGSVCDDASFPAP